jgi:hypothetical protein
MTMKRSGIAFVVGLACSGCADEHWRADADFEWHGTYVSIYGYERDEGDVCGESLQGTDDYVRTLMDFHRSEASVHIDYRWMTPSTWNDAGLEAAGGLHSRGEIFSVELAQSHELSHAASWNVHGRTCTPVLEEGLAVVLEDAHAGEADYGEFDLDIEDLLVHQGEASVKEYYRAGHFVAFLLETYGLHGFRGMCQFLPRMKHSDLEDWDAATRGTLGLPLAEVLAAYAAYPECNHHQYRARLRDCAGDPDVIVNPNEPTEFSFRFACDEPDVIGEADGTMMLVRRVQVPVAGEYAIEVDDGSPPHEREVVAIHEQCATCSQQPLTGLIADVPLPDDELCPWLESPAECGYHSLSGMHAFIFFLDQGLDRDVTVRIVPNQ